MKKIILLAGMAVMVATTVVTFDSCRKGSEDPAISLRSRKARLVGDWKLTAGNDTSVYNSSTYYTEYTEINKTDKYGSGTSTVTNYEEKMTFNGDGTYTMYTKTTNTSGNSVDEKTISGTWDFNSGVGGETKKEKVILTALSIVQTTTQGSSITTSTTSLVNNVDISTLELVRLSNKELKIYSVGNSTQTGSSTSTYKSSSHKTYSAQ